MNHRTDFTGRPYINGDRIAYAVRKGSSLTMYVARVLDVERLTVEVEESSCSLEREQLPRRTMLQVPERIVAL